MKIVNFIGIPMNRVRKLDSLAPRNRLCILDTITFLAASMQRLHRTVHFIFDYTINALKAKPMLRGVLIVSTRAYFTLETN